MDSYQILYLFSGLDDALLPYSNLFLEHDLNGKKLMLLTHSDLEKIGIMKLGHQELMLEAVDLLKALRYGYDTENLQHLALQLGCKAKSLYNEIQPKSGENDPNKANNSSHVPRRLSINILAAVADLIMTLKNLVSWLDRAPFESIYDMGLFRNTVVKLGMDLIAACQKDGTEVDVEDNIVKCCHMLADICEDLTLSNTESLMFQPAYLELATIRKKPGEELGMHILSSYYGVHVIGAIKDMSPADLCRKIEKGDEVVQVNQKTVVGWQLKKLVNCLKEKPKEVALLLKKRPQHMNPFGQNNNRKKQLKNLHAPQVSTLPKKRTSRAGEEAKQIRPSLHELVSSIPTEDLYSPKEERTSDEKDDGNDTDNDVFRSGSESPQYTLPVVVDPKQRRATVSGGSPTLSRPLLVIDDLDTPTRPKSFTVGTADASQTEYKDLLVPGADGSPMLNGSLKGGGVQHKRQEYKVNKPGQQSLEFTVKKPIPVLQEPDKELVLQDLREQKKVLDLLEVPSQFQNPNHRAYESTTDDVDDDDEEDKEDDDEKVDNGTTEELEESEKQIENKEDVTEGDKVRIATTVTESKKEDVTEGDKVSIATTVTESKTEDDAGDQSTQDEVTTDVSTPDKPTLDDHHTGSDFDESNKPENKSLVSVEARDECASSAPSAMHVHVPTRRELHASYVDYEAKSSPAESSVATNRKHKSEPKLIAIRKIDSLTAADVKSGGKSVTFSSPKEKQQEVSYTTIVVGGVVQKIPIESGSSTPTDMSSPVTLRKKKVNKRVDRRVSCKDLGEGDCEGYLYKRKQKQGILSGSSWLKRWCVLKQYNLFYFKDKEDLKAEGVLHLPAFQVSPANDITKRKHAFKVHNAGTTFVFASESQNDMRKWMNKLGLAAINFSPPKVIKPHGSPKHSPGNKNDEFYSESEDEDDSKDPLTRSASSGSCTSLSSQTSTPEREVKVYKKGQSMEDLTSLMRSIEKEDLTLTGQSKQLKRRNTIRASKRAARKGAQAAAELPPSSSDEHINKVKKINCLKRTLKAKEQELADIEKALTEKTVSGDSLKALMEHIREHDFA
ncbi:hypothetical protein FSP39_003211 [Pinctada imbricata]|uniref:Connector enhancer of kinase suppressor of ras 2 n=1 Tax=Pinctada imbricata TaxID=66713 RepID=A0AA89BZS8_PINIB|nr:hypothetical protein FSP39_003211 [Pinctada imbricata]